MSRLIRFRPPRAATIRPMAALADDDTPTTVFSNPTPITINTVAPAPTVASPYPSTINVSGMTGTTTKIAVTLNNLSHPRPHRRHGAGLHRHRR